MDIEPRSLNIPLERKEYWGVRLVLACVCVVGVSALFSPSFAIVFAASSIVGLPVLLVTILPSPISARLLAWGDWGRIVFAVVVLGYVMLAKTIFVPLVISAIENLFS